MSRDEYASTKMSCVITIDNMLICSFFSFSSVVLFLKVLLQQADLDKPFTGGLGSYKLYVLVANHVRILVIRFIHFHWSKLVLLL